ncbi:MAG: DNA polymerase III subunit gamma/tau [Leptothrix sp. (in: b-proteobacteria)]
MSYLVLARKYRPRSFAEMVGQEHVVQALGNALTQQRLHHAYLFTGTRGVGKTTVSRILAKSLNCTGPDGSGGITAQPCGVCPACRDIDAGRFVDYVELDAASNRGVDEISQLLDQSVYKPVLGRFKVYLIDEVHMLTTTAFNAMLKTLEEPPEYLKFVLATTDPQKVPVTVLSRCLQFNLRPMAPATIFEHLGQVLAAEQIAAEPGALRLMARAAQGSMRDALSLTDQAIAFGAGRIDEAGVRQMLGAVDRSHVVRIVEALAASNGAALVGEVDALRAQGLSAAGTLEELATLAQQMAVLQAVPEAADAQDPDTPTVQRLAPLLSPEETQLLYSIAIHGRAELGLAPDEYSALVMVLLRLLAFRPKGGATLAAPVPGAAPVRSAPVVSSPAAVTSAPAPVRAAAVVATATPSSPSAAPKPEQVEPASSPARPVATAPVESPPVAPAPVRTEPVSAPLPAPVRAAPAPMLATPRQPAPASVTPTPTPVRQPTAAAPAPAARPPLAARPASAVAEPRRAAPVSSLEEPAWLSAEEPPLEDPRPSASTASRPPWEDDADQLSAAPPRPATDNRSTAVRRASAPLLAQTAAQARYTPRQAAPAPVAAESRAPVVAQAGERSVAAPVRVAAPMPVAAPSQAVKAAELPAVAASAASAVPADVADLPADPLTDRWVGWLQQLLERQTLAGFTRELGWQAQCVAIDEAATPRQLVLRVERESLRQGAHRERLQAALAELFGVAVALEVEAGPITDSAARRDIAAKARAQQQAEALIRNDPLVQRLLERFPGAKLVPGSIRPC